MPPSIYRATGIGVGTGKHLRAVAAHHQADRAQLPPPWIEPLKVVEPPMGLSVRTDASLCYC